MPFREAHGVVGDLVRRALDDGSRLSDIPPEELSQFSDLLDEEYYAVLGSQSAIDAKRSFGGTSPAAVSEQLDRARAALAETRA
jgi:argininosuccinate lyase